MSEPNIEAQIKEIDRKYMAKLITKKQYMEQLASVAKQYDEWLRKND